MKYWVLADWCDDDPEGTELDIFVSKEAAIKHFRDKAIDEFKGKGTTRKASISHDEMILLDEIDACLKDVGEWHKNGYHLKLSLENVKG